MIDVDDTSFSEEVLNFEGTVFVDFWAEWCGPCKVMLPLYERLSVKYSSENIKFVKYEAGSEGCTSILKEYNILGIPSFLCFRNGSQIDTMVGAGNLEDFITAKVNSND